MVANKRRKRASDSDLYKSCVLGGDCLPDVKNKVEGTTLADKLLQWFGSIIYLGGLGIGTGKGGGGPASIRPSAVPGRIPEVIPLRPTAPLEPIPEVVPGEVLPGVIGAEAPSIVPMTDVTLDPTVIVDNEVAVVPLAPSNEVHVLYDTINPVYDTATVPSRPTIITGPDESIAVLDVSTSAPPPRHVALDTAYLGGGTSDILTHADVSNVFVDPQLSAATIGFEEIELGPLQSSIFSVEEPPIRSTPLSERLINRATRLYNTFTQQVRINDPLFISQPSRLVQFEYDNPAFTDADLTLEFAKDVASVEAAPVSEFEDIHVLHRQVLGETPGRTVRVSRLGRKGLMQTRSGTLVGRNVHFYMDLSAIETADAMELMPVGSTSGNSTVVEALAESTFVDTDIVPDSELLDEFSEDFSDSHLVVISEEGRSSILPTFSERPFRVTPVWPNATYVVYPTSNIVPTDISTPSSSEARLNIFSDDFYLHPSLLRRRKRKRSDDF